LLVYDLPIYPFGTWGVFLYIVITAYAITKHELMNIRLAITRSISFVISFSSLSLSFSYPYFLLLNNTVNSLTFGLINLSVLVFWSLSFHRFRLAIQTPLEEKWVKQYSPQKLLTQMAIELATITDRELLLHTLLDVCHQHIRLRNISGFYLLPSKVASETVLIPTENSMIQEKILPNHPIKVFFDSNSSPILWREISDSDKGSWQNLPISTGAIVIPLLLNNTLEGLVIFNEKISEEQFSKNDLEVLSAIQAQSTVVLDRIRPYEQIKSELILAQAEAEEAKAYATKVAQQASFGTLTKGIAHELRNPLSILTGLTNVFIMELKAGAEKENLMDMAKDIRRGGNRLTNILDAMLKFGETTENAQFEPFDLRHCIDNATHLLSGECKGNGINLSVKIEENLTILGDSNLISQVIFNFILNSIQSFSDISRDQKAVNLEAKTSKGTVIISITDNGCGIEESEKSKIFDLYYSTKYQNSGMGLPLSMKIMEHHNGTLKFESKKGKGSTFTIVLPAIQPPKPKTSK
jgi:signal transduction histidine kinase